MSRHVYAAVKKCVLSLLRKVDKELVLRMSIGSEFRTFGAATLNARFAVWGRSAADHQWTTA